MSHTAGPWEIVDDQIIEDERGPVAIVWAPEYVPLIAAAPELLVAVKELRLLVDGEGGMPEGVRSRADAAIAKATGGAR